MSTAVIIAIVVVVLALLVLLVVMPRMRAKAQHAKAERELHDRRRTVADEHRSAADEGQERAERAAQRARLAEKEAERERAEAGVAQERAQMHEKGMADDELIADDERDRFEGVANTGSADADRDGHTMDDRARNALGRDDDRDGVDDRREGEGAHSAEYEQGREDERAAPIATAGRRRRAVIGARRAWSPARAREAAAAAVRLPSGLTPVPAPGDDRREMGRRAHDADGRAGRAGRAAPGARRPPGVAAGVLSLQRAVGNRAARQILARDTRTAAPAFRLLIADRAATGCRRPSSTMPCPASRPSSRASPRTAGSTRSRAASTSSTSSGRRRATTTSPRRSDATRS